MKKTDKEIKLKKWLKSKQGLAVLKMVELANKQLSKKYGDMKEFSVHINFNPSK